MFRGSAFVLLSAVLLWALSARAFGLSAELSQRLSGLSSDGEGTPVTESVLARGDRPGTELQKKIKKAVQQAAPFLDKSVRNGGWNDSKMGIDGPVCFDAAPKLALLLRTSGYPAHVAASGHHVFIVVESDEATLIVDPTIHQYFGQDAAPAWAPQIFVGTLSELKALYEREPGFPVMPYDQVYFSKDDPSFRRDSKILSARTKLQYLWFNSEEAPLIEYLQKH